MSKELTPEIIEGVFNKGDRISYTYKHYLNSKSYTTITKEGTFIRRVKRKYNLPYKENTPACVVKFDGNKGNSTVLITDIEHYNSLQTNKKG